MSSYCRITGRSRGLTKPNYFPLLPPISPADAKRLCRITGKSYGLPTHHYIPVLVGSSKKHPRIPCHITTKAEGQEAHHYYPGVKHVILKDYRYFFPTLGTSLDLTEILESKTVDNEHKYVYTVNERLCSLVFPSRLEAAVRDGDVKDVMLAKNSDTLLLTLRKGQSVEVDVTEISVDGIDLFEGEGPSDEAVCKRKKRKKTGNEWRTKIFEEKERVAEMEERNSEKTPKRMKMKLKAIKEAQSSSWKNVEISNIANEDHILEGIAEPISTKMMNGELVSLLNSKGTPIIDKLPTPLKIIPEEVNLSSSNPGIVQQPVLEHDTLVGFPIISVVAPFRPLVAEVKPEIQEAINLINQDETLLSEMLEQDVKLLKEHAQEIPSIGEIQEIVGNLEKIAAITYDQNEPKKRGGLKLDIASAQKYVPGQFVETPSGPVFVPGSAVATPLGPTFIPGFTISTPDGVKFLPGQIIHNETNGEHTPVFVTGQTVLTREGEKFVQGQMIQTNEGVRFVPGQTVFTPSGTGFIPGQIIEDKNNGNDLKFVPGQIIMSQEGPQFVPGQFSETTSGKTSFTPGQSVLNENCNWEFVPGQSVKTKEGNLNFVPGKNILLNDGYHFVPGKSVITDGNTECFVPGVTTEDETGAMHFIPGIQLVTAEGEKFIEGMVVKEDEKLVFAPGKILKNKIEENMFTFNVATSITDVELHDAASFGISMKAAVFPDNDPSNEVFGHMIQSSQGVEFFPGVSRGLPAGKVIPGRLVRDREIRFIPGTMINDRFVPGQMVMTDKGEQFIPGQVIETNEGPKFVPGQVLETKSGSKFVPGQTVQTEDGPKFIPGQIVETKAGPTFIPGQVISTEEEGPRFVPGQVVDTAEGPRFVPGRVVETGDHVTFIPGQIVETEEGLRFIAPDLEDDPEGGYQFTVQGFQITEEELRMLQKNSISHTLFNSFEGETAIDSTMLQQLSNAGMAIGHEVPVNVPVVNIKSLPVTEMACKLGEKLKIDALYSVKLSNILTNMQQLAESGNAISFEEYNDNIKILLNAVSDFANSNDFISNMTDVLEGMINSVPEQKLEIIDDLHVASIHLVAQNRDEKPNKLATLRAIIRNGFTLNEEAVRKLTSVLNNEEIAVCSAFQHISQENPELVEKVLLKVAEMLDETTDEANVAETLHRAIIKTVTEASESTVQEVLHNTESEEFRCLVLDAIGLARALGMTEIVVTLSDVLSDPKSVQILAHDSITLEVLKRLTIMRQLACSRPSFDYALSELQTDPYSARKNPQLRELVRESAALMVVPEESLSLKSSADIPASLLFGDNSLAVEDFMVRSRHSGSIFLILKKGMQAVVPREAAKLVLTGKVPYTLLDENGVRYFKPLHYVSILKLPQFANSMFSMYGDSAANSTDDENSSPIRESFEDMRKSFQNRCSLAADVNHLKARYTVL